jgi:hypothetical protein
MPPNPGNGVVKNQTIPKFRQILLSTFEMTASKTASPGPLHGTGTQTNKRLWIQ